MAVYPRGSFTPLTADTLATFLTAHAHPEAPAACLRRHWGSGAADLVCREMITHAWTHGRQAIIAWADASNTAVLSTRSDFHQVARVLTTYGVVPAATRTR